MRHLALLLTTHLFFSCYSPSTETPTTETNGRPELIPEPDKELRLAYEAYMSSQGPDSSHAALWCDTEILGSTQDSLENLNLKLVSNFLSSIHRSCKNNVEFSEWSNELLFEVTSRKAELVHQVLSKDSDLDREQIVWEYAQPIHDEFDLEDIRSKVSAMYVAEGEDDEIWKQRMLNALEEAQRKYQ